MRTTIDAAGRIVIPKALRDQIGLLPGPVSLDVDGATLRLSPLVQDDVVERQGRLLIPASGTPITDDVVGALRAADQR